jgi:hypothetical protein
MIRRFYGSHPLHLLALLCCFALTGYIAIHITSEPALPRILLWFVGAVVGHDLILFPLYAIADHSLSHAVRIFRPTALPLRNYLRIPALGAGLLFVMFFPGIIRQGAARYHTSTGQTQAPFLERWLLLTAAMFAISAIIYAIRLRTK